MLSLLLLRVFARPTYDHGTVSAFRAWCQRLDPKRNVAALATEEMHFDQSQARISRPYLSTSKVFMQGRPANAQMI
jgi:hypothetical protein